MVSLVKVAQIAAVAAFLPKDRLDNKTLVAAFPKWTEEKIERKLGIVERPIAARDETALDLGAAAARRLFDAGLARPNDVDFLVFCTQSPDYFLPPSACILQDRLGLPLHCGAFDVNLGCSGFVYGLGVCKGLLESGQARKVLFITAETYTKYVNKRDSVSRPIFGDGAAATLVELSEEDYASNDVFDGAPTFGPFEYGSDGAGAKLLIVEAGAARMPKSHDAAVEKIDLGGNWRSQEQLYMNGAGVFDFSINVVPPLVKRFEELARRRNLTIDTYVLHQANKFMLDRLRDLCEIDENKFYNNCATRGNTVSSTIPIALIDAMRDKMIAPGSLALFCGFGVGLSWGACLARLPETFRVAPLD